MTQSTTTLKDFSKLTAISYIVAGWFVGSVFLCLIAFSRYVCIAERSMIGVYFSLCYFSSNRKKWYPEHLSWNLSPNTTLSKFYKYQSLTINLSSVVLLLIFNVLTFVFILKTRRLVVNFDHERQSWRLEIKLFVQCAINCFLYSSTIVLFNLSNVFLQNCLNIRFIIALNFVWILHHCCNPVIYFTLNSQFRSDCLRFLLGNHCVSIVESEITVVVAKNARLQRY
uniref:7TM GPCR serpentine receptor class x (Srx) domain-containing protein n=1 Tax=Romanomermis culicivorax TaxID=13658 RepID=A0A915HSC8_ROMCU